MPRSSSSSSTSTSRASKGRSQDAVGKPGTRKGPNARAQKAKAERDNAAKLIATFVRRLSADVDFRR